MSEKGERWNPEEDRARLQEEFPNSMVTVEHNRAGQPEVVIRPKIEQLESE
jgi:hypothetical protein